MLSNPLQRFSPYNNLPSSSSSIGVQGHNHVTRTHTRSNGLNPLRQTYHYALPEPEQHSSIQARHLSRSSQQPKPRHQPYASGTKSSASSGGVRRRISRACDQCNQLRTKCDGQHPCAHCVEFGLGCEYARERKKRGKASRKDLAQQAAAQAAADATTQNGSNDDSQDGESDESVQRQQNSNSPSPSVARRSHSISHTDNGAVRKLSAHEPDSCLPQTTANNAHVIGEITGQIQLNGHTALDQSHMNNTQIFDLNTFTAVSPSYDRQGLNGSLMPHEPYGPSQAINNYSDIPYGMQIHSSSSYGNAANFRVGDNSLDGYAISTTSPGWDIPGASPAGLFQQAQASQGSFQRKPNLRYPVLEPLIPHLGNIIPLGLACDLLDLYFSSSSSAQMHPMSPYVLGFVFRKRAFLHPTKPRKCQPALLASMLWLAAQTSEASFLTSLPSARSKVCHKLLNLTIGLLKPLIHTPSAPPAAETSPVVGAVSLGSLGVAVPGSISMDTLTGEGGAFGAAGNVDDVATYIHLATVVSASEYKGASIRWWNAAWSLGRELKLGRELPPNDVGLAFEQLDGDDDGLDEHDVYRNTTEFITEEDREERRRIWWLIYIVDRHLALCYNRPLFLLDVECDELLRPMDDTKWQRGDFRSRSNRAADDDMLNPAPNGTGTGGAVRGPDFECRGHSIFGYFLPLMTILGEVVDLHHARNHPRFGADFRPHQQWHEWTSEITRHLEVYEHSLKKFERKHLPKKTDDKSDEPSFGENGESHGIMPEMGTPSTHSGHTNTSNRMTESEIQARIVVAYSTHVMHVLHILLTGKWDPISLIDDNDFWISSQGFVTATSHAVAAAEAINQILEFDAGLEYMPFFFGIYLLQGSFLLLLIADKLQYEASSNVVRACETIVRAHEACVVTLSTEYQRNFSKVMRSALAVVRGRVPEDLTEQHQRKRELLGLYRWTGDGTGLAL